MAPRAPSNPTQRAPHEPLFDVHPQTGASIEVFYADRTLETFGRRGGGWFWWSRRPGLPPRTLGEQKIVSMCQAWDTDGPTRDATG
jgi:hypothetical protein